MLKFFKKTLVFLFGIAMVVLVSGYVWIHPGRGPVEKVDPNEKGYAEEIDGTLVLHLKGSPYEMGFQRGSLAREKVQLMVSRFDDLLNQAKKEMGLPKFAANLILDVTYQLCSPYIPERYRREMEGLADGSGADLQVIRRGQVISVITERGCSSFALWGKATTDGKLYQGRNFDWILSAGLEDTAVLALYEPDGHNRFASVGYAGQIGVLSGMNMEGMSIAQIGAITKDKSLRGIPLEFVLRRILEECSDLDQVTGLINSVKHTVGYNYVIADGDARDARAYETTAHHVAMFGPNDPKETCEYAIRIEDAVFRADEAMDPTVRGLQECANAPGMPYGSNSYDHRYKGIATRIQQNYGKIDQSIALDILRATAMEGDNLHSVLTNTTDRQMWVAHAKNGQEACRQKYVHYDLNRLFLRPDARPAENSPVPIAPAAASSESK